MPEKTISRTLIAAIILLVIIAVAAGAVIYITQSSSPKPSAQAISVGVKIGDSFTYKLIGQSIGATAPSYLLDFNNTQSYKVIITAITGYVVTVETLWTFTNQTTSTSQGTINIATGAYTGSFWAIYPSNLNLNNLVNPQGQDGLIVNSTNPQTYTAATRQTNYWSTDNVFGDSSDPTNSTQCVNFVGVYFDRQTGMLVSLTNQQEFVHLNADNTQTSYTLMSYMQLVSSSVWTI